MHVGQFVVRDANRGVKKEKKKTIYKKTFLC